MEDQLPLNLLFIFKVGIHSILNLIWVINSFKFYQGWKEKALALIRKVFKKTIGRIMEVHWDYLFINEYIHQSSLTRVWHTIFMLKGQELRDFHRKIYSQSYTRMVSGTFRTFRYKNFRGNNRRPIRGSRLPHFWAFKGNLGFRAIILYLLWSWGPKRGS